LEHCSFFTTWLLLTNIINSAMIITFKKVA